MGDHDAVLRARVVAHDRRAPRRRRAGQRGDREAARQGRAHRRDRRGQRPGQRARQRAAAALEQLYPALAEPRARRLQGAHRRGWRRHRRRDPRAGGDHRRHHRVGHDRRRPEHHRRVLAGPRRRRDVRPAAAGRATARSLLHSAAFRLSTIGAFSRMRIARFSAGGDVGFAVLEGDELAVLDRPPVRPGQLHRRAPAAGRRTPARADAPEQVVAIGRNYAEHAARAGQRGARRAGRSSSSRPPR